MIKFAIIGIGNRAIKCYIKPLVNEFSDKCKLVGLYDINFPRAKYISKTLPYKVNVFDSLTTMIEECHFDYCIICSKDSSHFQIIKELLDHGKKIICEKPIVIKKNEVDYLYFNNNKNLINVVHNCRLMPINKTIKNLLSNNVVGNVLQIDYIANIDLKHGREYFRRWHSEYKNTGGLLIHKSSHHFDLLNWWLNCIPQNLCAFGKLNYFGNNKKFNNANCRSCTEKCPNIINLNNTENEIYYKFEYDDGYIRDKCIYRSYIDIFDSYNAIIKYSNGCIVSYSANYFSPTEETIIRIIGEKGVISTNITKNNKNIIKIENSNDVKIIEFENNNLKHFGADNILLDSICKNDLSCLASTDEALLAVKIGLAANESILKSKVISLEGLK